MSDELRQRLDRIEAKLDELLARPRAVEPQTICGGCGMPIGPRHGFDHAGHERLLTFDADFTPRHSYCKGR